MKNDPRHLQETDQFEKLIVLFNYQTQNYKARILVEASVVHWDAQD